MLLIVLHALTLYYSVRPNATIIEYTKSYAKPRQSNLLSSCIKDIKTFLSNTHYTLQKVQTLRAAFPSKLENTINTTLFSKQITLNYLQNGRCSFISTTLLMYSTTPTIFTNNPIPYLSYFSPAYFHLTS